MIGAGAVGLLCAAVAKSSGYSRVVMADIASNRLAFARRNGFADETLELVPRRADSIESGLAYAREDAAALVGKNEGEKFARTFECTGVEGCVRTAIYVSHSARAHASTGNPPLAMPANLISQATRGGGKVLLVGMGTPIQTLPMSAAALREVDLIGVWRYANCYPRGLEIMEKSIEEASVPDLRTLVTHSFKGLSSVPEAFSMAGRTSDDTGALVVKVVVQN